MITPIPLCIYTSLRIILYILKYIKHTGPIQLCYYDSKITIYYNHSRYRFELLLIVFKVIKM